MKASTVEHIGGLVLLLGGLMGAVAHIIHPLPPENAQAMEKYIHSTVRAHLLLGASVLLVCLGLPALYARIRESSGIAAFLSLPLLFFGLMLGEFMHCPVEVAIFPELASLGYTDASSIVGHMFSGSSVYGRVQALSTPLIVAGVFCLLFGTRRVAIPRWPKVFLVGFLVFLLATFLPIPQGLPTGRIFAVCLYVAFAGYGAEILRHSPA